jgi:colicin import membrane protein
MEMKAGLTTSVVLHAAVIGFGLISLSSPRALEMADSEALPVEIVPVESMTQIQQGDKKAPKAEKSAPVPTKKPDIVENAQKVGDNTVDTDKPPTPEAKPKPVETAAAAAPSPRPVEDRKPEPAKQPEAKPVPTPATETTPQPQPKQEVKPDPAPETAVSEMAEAESVKLPDSVPSPAARPQPPQAQTAKAPERKEAEKPAKEQASRPKSEEKEFNADEVAALLNKEKAAGGGAKRSTQQAALGGKKTTSGEKLTQSEMDALKGQIQRCWNIPAGAMDGETLLVSVKFKLNPAGEVEGSPEVIDGGGSTGVQRAAAEAARRAVVRCAPNTRPPEKYETWADVIVNFDPSEMF